MLELLQDNVFVLWLNLRAVGSTMVCVGPE